MRRSIIAVGVLVTGCSANAGPPEHAGVEKVGMSSAAISVATGSPSTISVTELGTTYTVSVQSAQPLAASATGGVTHSTHVMPDGSVLTYASENAAPNAGSIAGPAQAMTSHDAGVCAACSGDPRLGVHVAAATAATQGSINQCTLQASSVNVCTLRGEGYALYTCPRGVSPFDATCDRTGGWAGSSSQQPLCCKPL